MTLIIDWNMNKQWKMHRKLQVSGKNDINCNQLQILRIAQKCEKQHKNKCQNPNDSKYQYMT